MCNCSGSGICRSDIGSFSESTQSDTIYGDASCEPNTGWGITHTVNPQNASSEDYDEVEPSYKNIFLNSYFSDVPYNQLRYDCELDDKWPNLPHNVEYYIRHPSGEDENEYDFVNLTPDDSGSGQNYIMNTILDVASGISSNPLVGIGSALVKNYIGYWSSSSVDDGYYNSGPRRYAWWDLDYDQTTGFPTDPCDTTSVRFRLQTATNSGYHSLDTWTRYDFTNFEYVDHCSCDERDITSNLITTDWVTNTVTFEFVS